MIRINTKNILFICGGFCDGIEKLICKRLNTGTLGFQKQSTTKTHYSDTKLLQSITAEDLKAYGFIPEFIGRLPIIGSLEPIDKAVLKRF